MNYSDLRSPRGESLTSHRVGDNRRDSIHPRPQLLSFGCLPSSISVERFTSQQTISQPYYVNRVVHQQRKPLNDAWTAVCIGKCSVIQPRMGMCVIAIASQQHRMREDLT